MSKDERVVTLFRSWFDGLTTNGNSVIGISLAHRFGNEPAAECRRCAIGPRYRCLCIDPLAGSYYAGRSCAATRDRSAIPRAQPHPHFKEPIVKKVHTSAASALDGLLFDGMTIAAGGFGLCGIPGEPDPGPAAMPAPKGLTIVGNNAGVDDFGMGPLLKTAR
jgi:hypothetical protein